MSVLTLDYAQDAHIYKRNVYLGELIPNNKASSKRKGLRLTQGYHLQGVCITALVPPSLTIVKLYWESCPI